MNLNKPYPPEKRAFILKKSDDELWSFFEGISTLKKKKLITQILPKAKGFRANSPYGVHRRFKMLIKEASGPKNSLNTQKAWNAISLIWTTWIDSCSALQKLLEKYDNSADFQKDEKVKFPNINTSLDIGCFTYLAKANHHQLSHSLIQSFYEFGYFQPDSTIEFIIKTIQDPSEKPNDVVEKVEKELTLEKWQKVLQELQVRVTQIETNHAKPYDSEQEQVSLSLKKDLAEVKKALDNVLTRVSTLEKNQQNLATQLSTAFVEKIEKLSINHQLDKTANTLELEELKQQFGMLEKTLNDEISPTVELINQQLSNLYSKKEVDELKQQVDKLKEELSIQEELFFDELEQHNTASPIPDSAREPIQQTGLYTSTLQHSDSPRILSSTEKQVSHLTKNLTAIGLIKGGVEKLAKEILAGLSAGELIVFSGSFAFNLAEVCTQALAAKQPPIVIHIPIGLLNGQQFSDSLCTTINNAKQSEQVCAIIIEGINRSALESYAQALRQIIIKRLLGLNDPAPNFLFFGTLVEGLSTLPVPLELCELGPIFDTDVLGWRSQFKPQASIAGAIPCFVWQNRVTTMSNDSAEPNCNTDLAEVCNDFAFCRSHLWQLCVKQACRYLDNDLQPLAFGWLVPRAIAAEMEHLEIKDGLLNDIFKGDEEIPDKRLEKLLRNPLKEE